MAEDHGDSGGSGHTWPWIIIGVVAIGVAVYGLSSPFEPTYINLDYLFSRIYSVVHVFIDFLFNYETGLWLKAVIAGVCMLLVILIIYLILRLFEMEKEHADHMYPIDHATYAALSSGATTGETSEAARAHFEALEQAIETSPGQARWEKVLDFISSQNPSDWRLAIIDADAILDTLIEAQGYPGENMGERLKNAGAGAFRTYNEAWEAHRVRNQIAHEGTNFELSYRDAKHTIDRYENVLREFDYI